MSKLCAITDSCDKFKIWPKVVAFSCSVFIRENWNDDICNTGLNSGNQFFFYFVKMKLSVTCFLLSPPDRLFYLAIVQDMIFFSNSEFFVNISWVVGLCLEDGFLNAFKLLIVWLWRRAFLFFLLSIFRRWQNIMGDIQRSPEPQDVSIDCFVTSSLNQYWFYWFLYLDGDVIQRVWLKQSILFCFTLS